MANQNVLNDIGTLIRIPNKTMDELSNKACLCIGSIICDAKLAGEKMIEINIGIGTLSVNLTDMQCKFVPGKQLKQTIKKGIETGIDPLECALEEELADKLVAACAEVF